MTLGNQMCVFVFSSVRDAEKSILKPLNIDDFQVSLCGNNKSALGFQCPFYFTVEAKGARSL